MCKKIWQKYLQNVIHLRTIFMSYQEPFWRFNKRLLHFISHRLGLNIEHLLYRWWNSTFDLIFDIFRKYLNFFVSIVRKSDETHFWFCHICVIKYKFRLYRHIKWIWGNYMNTFNNLWSEFTKYFSRLLLWIKFCLNWTKKIFFGEQINLNK